MFLKQYFLMFCHFCACTKPQCHNLIAACYWEVMFMIESSVGKAGLCLGCCKFLIKIDVASEKFHKYKLHLLCLISNAGQTQKALSNSILYSTIQIVYSQHNLRKYNCNLSFKTRGPGTDTF